MFFRYAGAIGSAALSLAYVAPLFSSRSNDAKKKSK